MIIGTAGFTAALGIWHMLHNGLTPEKGPVLVTGAAGGVGSVAVSILAKLGFQVTAASDLAQADYLREIGAKTLDVDAVPVEKKPGAPSIVRALMEDDEGRRFLVGSDGSTHRTYYMETSPQAKTCAEAHTFLCGFDEAKIIAQS